MRGRPPGATSTCGGREAAGRRLIRSLRPRRPSCAANQLVLQNRQNARASRSACRAPPRVSRGVGTRPALTVKRPPTKPPRTPAPCPPAGGTGRPGMARAACECRAHAATRVRSAPARQYRTAAVVPRDSSLPRDSRERTTMNRRDEPAWSLLDERRLSSAARRIAIWISTITI